MICEKAYSYSETVACLYIYQICKTWRKPVKAAFPHKVGIIRLAIRIIIILQLVLVYL